MGVERLVETNKCYLVLNPAESRDKPEPEELSQGSQGWVVVSKEIHQLLFEETDRGRSAVEHQQNKTQPVVNSTSTEQQLASSISAWICFPEIQPPMPCKYRPDNVVKQRHQMVGRGCLTSTLCKGPAETSHNLLSEKTNLS